MNQPGSIARLIFDTLPQLYQSQAGAFPVELEIAGEKSRLFSTVALSPELEDYLKRAEVICQEVQPITGNSISDSLGREWVQQKFAVAWLESRTQITSWNVILDYFRRLSRRTTENRVMPKTVVIEPGKPLQQAANLTDPSYFKVFDWLASTPMTYFRVDQKLGIKGLESVSQPEIKDVQGYRFYPDDLHPVISTLKQENSVVFHMTANGSFLIADHQGVLASKRRGASWTIFDRDHIVLSVAEILSRQIGENKAPEDPTCVACSLFQIIFDIAIKRQGGLIVLDRAENLKNYVLKGIARDDRSPQNTMNAIFTHSPFNGLEYSIPEVRKLVELSSVDGALILDLQGNLVQLGSMIISHASAINAFGMRDAAAYSAAKYGATAFKISADGQISLFFTTPEFTQDEVHRLDFL